MRNAQFSMSQAAQLESAHWIIDELRSKIMKRESQSSSQSDSSYPYKCPTSSEGDSSPTFSVPVLDRGKAAGS